MTDKVLDDACGDVYLSEARQLVCPDISPTNPNPSNWYSQVKAGEEMQERIRKYGSRREEERFEQE